MAKVCVGKPGLSLLALDENEISEVGPGGGVDENVVSELRGCGA